MSKTSGIYIHIPFCASKCLYCDFYTGGARMARWDIYIDSLKMELEHRIQEIPLDILSTLYIGGGTPSLIPNRELQNLIQFVNGITGKKLWQEFTLEVNPEDVTANRIYAWKDIGINRISMGIQSLNDQELKLIKRRHSAKDALKALDLLQKEFKNVTVDVIYGLPGQSINSYKNTLEIITSRQIPHVSAYSLMVEKGTALEVLLRNNKLEIPREEEWLEMYNFTNFLLNQGEYHRYEISNYAMQGMESIHNRSYWEGSPYLGLGPGAHSYDGGKIRRFNPNDIKGYLLNEKFPFYEEEHLTETEMREEMIMTRLRTTRGLSLTEFEERFGTLELKKILHESAKYLNSGLMKEQNRFLYFTDNGFMVSDEILSNLI